MAETSEQDHNSRILELYNVDLARQGSHAISSQQVTIIDEAVYGRRTAQSAAQQISALVIQEREPELSFMTILAISEHAAVHLEDENAAEKLAEFMTALASLPDAVNDSSEAKYATTYHPEVESGILTFQPGEAIVFENGRLWRDLPYWSMLITEGHQGPEQWLVMHRGKDTPEAAAHKWKNYNTYLASFAVNPDTRDIPSVAGFSWLGFKTLAVSLETAKDAWNFHADLWMPAAVQWMRIAGDELRRVCASEKKSYPAGELWVAEGGGDTCDIKRFEFWKKRLAEKGY